MNTDTIVYLTFVIALFLGWLPAAIIYRRKYVALKKSHRADLDNTWHDGFTSGWEAALNSPYDVRTAFGRLYGTKK